MTVCRRKVESYERVEIKQKGSKVTSGNKRKQTPEYRMLIAFGRNSKACAKPQKRKRGRERGREGRKQKGRWVGTLQGEAFIQKGSYKLLSSTKEKLLAFLYKCYGLTHQGIPMYVSLHRGWKTCQIGGLPFASINSANLKTVLIRHYTTRATTRPPFLPIQHTVAWDVPNAVC